MYREHFHVAVAPQRGMDRCYVMGVIQRPHEVEGSVTLNGDMLKL